MQHPKKSRLRRQRVPPLPMIIRIPPLIGNRGSIRGGILIIGGILIFSHQMIDSIRIVQVSIRMADVVDFHFEHLRHALCSVFYAGFFRTSLIGKERWSWNGSCPVFCLVNIYKPCWTIGFGVGWGTRSIWVMLLFHCWQQFGCRTMIDWTRSETKASPLLSAE